MNKRVIRLNGEWRMSWCDVGRGTPEHRPASPVLAYHVPGDVHTPLMQAGLIPDPMVGMNDLDCRWVEGQEFWCERRFTLAAEDIRPVMRLRFDGLDCTADVYLNGTHVGRWNNAFVEAVWDVSALVKTGENVLLVRIDQGLADAQTHDLARMGEMWNSDQPWRAWMRKPQFVYGWDWTIWLASCGIWRDVTLTGCHAACLADCYAHAADDVLCEGTPCCVAVEVTADRACTDGECVTCRILDRDGQCVASAAQPLNGSAAVLRLTVPRAHLWWCNGMGTPYLYDVQVTLYAADGQMLDEQCQRLGLRTIALEEPPLENGESGFVFRLNGERVFCKGANHVPCDCLPGRITPEREQRLIGLAQHAHMNMLRVWGGGVYASEAFMSACDEMGLMVWHDFMFACGYHPDHDAAFMANVTDEAEKAVRRLRRHTSLIGWAGNNEIQEMYHCQRQWDTTLPWYGGRIYEHLLPDVVSRLCPTLIYRPSSPFGGEYQADCRHGDQHIWLLTHVPTHPHYMDLWRFPEFDAKFLSEFGILGAMTLETAERCIPAAHMHPDDPIWLHHTNSAQEHRLMGHMLRRYFGTETFSPGQYILRSQALQAEITRHLYEEYRRRKFRCAGLLFWTLGDSMGIHNWSLVDYGLRRKPVYHALKQAMSPLAVCVKGWDVQTEGVDWRTYWANVPMPLEIWGMNDTLRAEEALLTWTLLTVDGEVLAESECPAVLPANQSVRLLTLSLTGVEFQPERTVLRVRLTQQGRLVNECKYFFAPFADMTAGNAPVDVRVRRLSAGQYEVTLTAERFVWMLHLAEPDGTVYSDNDFDLWPGEPRTVTVTTSDSAFQPRLDWMGKNA